MHPPDFTGVDLPYPSMRTLLPTLQAGTVTLLASWTTIGKTALAVDIARHTALAGTPTLYFSGHETREALAVRMLAATAGVDNTTLEKRPVPEKEMARVHVAKDHLSAAPLTIRSQVNGPMSQVVEQAKANQPRLLVVDDVDSLTDPDDLQEAELAKYGVMLSSLARTRQMSILVLSQLNRVPSDEYGRPPQLGDLGVRHSLTHACETILLMHRPDFYDPDDRPMEAELQTLAPNGDPHGKVTLGTLLARSQFIDLPQEPEKTAQ